MGKRGPKPQYERKNPDKKGAPSLTLRLDSDVYEHVKHHPEEPRKYVQRLVREDVDRTGAVMGHGQLNRDVPGQISLDGEEVGDGPALSTI